MLIGKTVGWIKLKVILTVIYLIKLKLIYIKINLICIKVNNLFFQPNWIIGMKFSSLLKKNQFTFERFFY